MPPHKRWRSSPLLDLSTCGESGSNIARQHAPSSLAIFGRGFSFTGARSTPSSGATSTTFRPKPAHDCLAIGFHCDEGDFLMQLFLTR
jgi:hypothetical protein